MGPDVAAVLGHEDRDVPDEADAAGRGESLEFLPLREEEPLAEAVGSASAPARRSRAASRRRFRTSGQPGIPVGPGSPRVVLLQRHEQGEVVEPGFLVGAPGVKFALAGGWSARSWNTVQARSSIVVFQAMTGPKSTRSAGKSGRRRRSSARQPAVAHQAVEADQQGVARKRRQGLVGRVAEAGRPQGQDLPQALAASFPASRRSGRPRHRDHRSRRGRANWSGAAGCRWSGEKAGVLQACGSPVRANRAVRCGRAPGSRRISAGLPSASIAAVAFSTALRWLRPRGICVKNCVLPRTLPR